MGLNNDDLISRAAAIECAIDAVDDWDGGWNPNRETVIRKYFEELPAVEAAPVVHARWDEIRDYTQAGLISFECSECGRLCDTLYKYFPRCGARMDGEADER